MQIVPACVWYLHTVFGIAGQASNVLTQQALCLIQPVLVTESIAQDCDPQVGLMNLVANRKADSKQG